MFFQTLLRKLQRNEQKHVCERALQVLLSSGAGGLEIVRFHFASVCARQASHDIQHAS